MRIPNKFNGYRPDGTRNLYDPATIAAIGSAISGGASVSGAMSAVAGGIGALETGMTLGTTLATGAELGGLASIFSNPSLALGGLESAAPAISTLAPEAAQAAAFNQATNTAVQEALKQQAAQQTAQNALGSKAFEAFSPATAQNQVLDAFRQAAANPVNPAQFPQYQPVASGAFTPEQLVEKTVEAEPYTQTPVADFSSYKGQTFLPEGAQYQDVVASMPGASMDTAINQAVAKTPTLDPQGNALSNLINLAKNPSMANAEEYIKQHPYATGIGALGLYSALKGQPKMPAQSPGLIRPYTFESRQNLAAYQPTSSTAERQYFTNRFVAGTPYTAPGPEYKAADGGLIAFGIGGPVEMMSAQNAVGDNTMYPQSQLQTPMYSNPMVQRPMPTNVISSGLDTPVDPYTGEQKLAAGGITTLGGYSDGGRLLKGPGDGVSDSIPAVIGDRQPARLADGEFVVPARIVSELGNGSTEAGARKLYAMMDRVQKARGKTTGKDKVATNTNADKHLPA